MTHPDPGKPHVADAVTDELTRVRLTIRIVGSYLLTWLIIPSAVLAAMLIGWNAGLPVDTLGLLGIGAFVGVFAAAAATEKYFQNRYLPEFRQMAVRLWRFAWISRMVDADTDKPLKAKSWLVVFILVIVIFETVNVIWVSIFASSEAGMALYEQNFTYIGLLLAIFLLSVDLVVHLGALVARRSSREKRT